MFRVWGKIVKKNKVIAEHIAVIENHELNRTRKVYLALDEICEKLNLSHPIWLDLNKKDFIVYSKTRFTSDNFIEAIDFNYLEFQVIEEDY